jgi:hypothetical protein
MFNIRKIKLAKDFWTYAKASLIAVSVVVALISVTEPIDSGDSPPPFWIAIIPVIFFGLFLPPFLHTFKPTEKYLNESAWPAFPFSPFRDPFPFWHFGAWGSLACAVPRTYHAFTPYNHDQLVIALLMWSCGAGALLGITGAKRKLRKKRNVEQEAKGDE